VIKPNILSHSTHHATSHKVTHYVFPFLFCVEKNRFYQILVQKASFFAINFRFPSSNLRFYVIKLLYSESASKTASRDVYFQTFDHLSFFDENSSHRFMLNLKKLFAEAKNKKQVENCAHFEKVVFFEKKTTHFEYFVFFDRKKEFTTDKEWIFAISSSNSIK